MNVALVIKDIYLMKETINRLKKKNKTIGFVPTMGYLHDGHLSLIKCSKKENDITVISIFINPIQFGQNEDLERYPRDIERDLRLCQQEKVDYIFYPSVNQMYPDGFSTYVTVEGITEGLCGAFRPGHFKGVATIVCKLFNIIKPDRAYFGKKDYQQFKVVQKMVKELNLDVQIIGCPIVREMDGLAMSSRNKYLSSKERQSASILYEALQEGRRLFYKGEVNPEKIKKHMINLIQSVPYVRQIQYIEIIDPETLKPRNFVTKGDVIVLAVFIGETRLIDNIEI